MGRGRAVRNPPLVPKTCKPLTTIPEEYWPEVYILSKVTQVSEHSVVKLYKE